MKQDSGNLNIVEIENALEFFNLHSDGLNEDILRQRFHELAHKYHPDTGEFSTSDIFNRLVYYRDLLKNFLLHQDALESNSSVIGEDDYFIYKKAKQWENSVILAYYKETEGNRIFLDAKENPALRTLIKQLKEIALLYERISIEFPESIWLSDSLKSLEKIKKTWLKEDVRER